VVVLQLSPKGCGRTLAARHDLLKNPQSEMVPKPRRGVRCECHDPKESGSPCAKHVTCY
jgi:hypothetical protein